jgi:hypothetical protein
VETSERKPGWRALALALAVAATSAVTAGSAPAAIPSTHAYLDTMQLRTADQVVAVNDGRIAGDAGRGGRVALEPGSHVTAPVDPPADVTARMDERAVEEGPGYPPPGAPVESDAGPSPGRRQVRSPGLHEPGVGSAAVSAPAVTVGPKDLSSEMTEELDGPPQTPGQRRMVVLLNLLVFGGVGGALAWRRLNAD